MSIHTLCDSCGKVIYLERSSLDNRELPHTILTLSGQTRYDSQISETVDLCKLCDLRLAQAVLKVLPRLAYRIEPNCAVSEVNWNEAEAH